MKRVELLLIIIATVIFTTCKKHGRIPLLTTQRPYISFDNKAICGGVIYSEGDDAVSVKGICWSTHSNPTIDNFKTKDGSGTGNFSSTMTGLKTETTYFIKAYATNKYGTAYGSEEALTVPVGAPPPVVLSRDAYSVTLNSAVAGGTTFINEGTAPILEAGVCWSSSTTPTKDNAHITSTISSAGAFTCSISGLQSNTAYTLRAYATNSTGTSYGAPKIVKTMFGTLTDIDNNTYYTVAIGTQVWMAENLRVTTYSNGTPIPLVPDNNTWWQSPATGAYSFYENLQSNTKYGALYSWKALTNANLIAPNGWHVPSQPEYMQLLSFLGGSTIAAASLKTNEPNYWPITVPASNTSGFTALPSGYRDYMGYFYYLQIQASFWTSTTLNTASVYTMLLYQGGTVSMASNNINGGYSLRLIRD